MNRLRNRNHFLIDHLIEERLTTILPNKVNLTIFVFNSGAKIKYLVTTPFVARLFPTTVIHVLVCNRKLRNMSTGKSALGKRRAAATKAPMATKKPRKPRGMVELPEGLTLTDLTKKQWRIGKLIGWGGFGALYLGNRKLQFSAIQIGNSSDLAKKI